MKNLFAFLFGALFSVGLMVSGMSNPGKSTRFPGSVWRLGCQSGLCHDGGDCGGLYSLPESITYGATENSI